VLQKAKAVPLHTTKVLGGRGGIDLLILDLGTRWGWVVSVTPRPRFNPGESTPGTHCTGCWVGPRAGLDTEARGKILSPLPGIEPRSPGRPARSQTLYWLSYPAHTCVLSFSYSHIAIYICLWKPSRFLSISNSRRAYETTSLGNCPFGLLSSPDRRRECLPTSSSEPLFGFLTSPDSPSGCWPTSLLGLTFQTPLPVTRQFPV
jgi:hypothetical protein